MVLRFVIIRSYIIFIYPVLCIFFFLLHNDYHSLSLKMPIRVDFSPPPPSPQKPPRSGASPTAATGRRTLGTTGATGPPTSRATSSCAIPSPASLCWTRWPAWGDYLLCNSKSAFIMPKPCGFSDRNLTVLDSQTTRMP